MAGHVNRNYLLAVLTVIMALSVSDRVAFGLLMQDIKTDFVLSDTQLGLLTGIAFALFYAVMGMPIARWADRGNRVTIITLTTGLWCVAVTLCSAATGFVQLLLIRIGVAVGEAGCMPVATSLLSDYFSRSERPRALSRYMLGTSLGTVVGYFVAGWLNEIVGWRRTFLALGLPGILLAVIAAVTLRDPRFTRPSVDAIPERLAIGSEGDAEEIDPTRAAPTWLEDILKLLRNDTFRHLLICFSIVSFFATGIGKWQAVFFIRSYGLSTGQLGAWLAAIFGAGGLLGMYVGGELASRLAARNEPLQLKGIALAYSSCSVGAMSLYLGHSAQWAFCSLGILAIASGAVSGPLFATIQSIVPSHLRATSISLIYLCANLIGMGFGPLAAGALSDWFRSRGMEDPLRYALLAMCPGYAWGGLHLWRASMTVTRDLQAAQAAASLTPEWSAD